MTETPATNALQTASSLSRDAGITAAVTVLFLLLRVLAVSQWNWYTAAEVAATVDVGDAASILLGTIFAEPVVTGILIIILTPLIIVTLIWPPTKNRKTPIVTALFLTGIAALAGSLIITLAEWWILIGTALATLALAAVRVLWKHGLPHRAALRLLRSLGMLGIVGALVMAAGVSTPWVALEHIETDTGPIYGYVLETPSGYVKVLTQDPREVHTLVSSTVHSREVLLE